MYALLARCQARALIHSPHCVSGIPNASRFDRASNGARNVNDRAIIAIEQSN